MLYKANWLALIFVADKEIQDENLSFLLNSYSFTTFYFSPPCPVSFYLFHSSYWVCVPNVCYEIKTWRDFTDTWKEGKKMEEKGNEKEESLIQSTLILFWLKVPVNKARWIYFFHELWHTAFQKTSLVYYIL